MKICDLRDLGWQTTRTGAYELDREVAQKATINLAGRTEGSFGRKAIMGQKALVSKISGSPGRVTFNGLRRGTLSWGLLWASVLSSYFATSAAFVGVPLLRAECGTRARPVEGTYSRLCASIGVSSSRHRSSASHVSLDVLRLHGLSAKHYMHSQRCRRERPSVIGCRASFQGQEQDDSEGRGAKGFIHFDLRDRISDKLRFGPFKKSSSPVTMKATGLGNSSAFPILPK